MRRYCLPIVIVLAASFGFAPAAVAQDSTYAPWQPPAQSRTQAPDMPQLLKQLRILIAKAEKAKAADPVFLSDLRKLADSYDSPWPITVLYDDFRDGEFTSNPAWTVSSGKWRIDTKYVGGLQTRVHTQQNTSSSQGGYNNQNTVLGIIGSLLQPQQNNENPQDTQDESAAITTPVNIANAFYIHLEIASRDSAGRFDFGPYQSMHNNAGYFLTYAPGQANGLTLSGANGGNTKALVDSNGPIRLEDGALHAIDWKRDRGGRMTVALDGRVVMETTEQSLNLPFDGFVMANSGGTYTIHSITINSAR